MRAIFELRRPLFFQAKISLVYQSGTLQGVVGTLLAHVMMSQSPQFVIHQRKNSVQCFVVARVPLDQ
jgi:hypothetical protein